MLAIPCQVMRFLQLVNAGVLRHSAAVVNQKLANRAGAFMGPQQSCEFLFENAKTRRTQSIKLLDCPPVPGKKAAARVVVTQSRTKQHMLRRAVHTNGS